MKAACTVKGAPQPLWTILRVPFWLFGFGLAGLVGALVVDGPLDLLGVMAAATGLPVIGWAVVRVARRRGP